VLQALQHELMQPEMVATFVAEFTAEWRRLCAEATSGTAALRRELAGVERQLQGLIDMIIDGFRAPGLQGRLDGFEARKSELSASIQAGDRRRALPRLHSNLAVTYRERVAALRTALMEGAGAEILETLRGLVDRVLVHPALEAGRVHIELVGHLSALLEASGAPATLTAGLSLGDRTRKTSVAGAAGVCSESDDAGTGFRLWRTRIAIWKKRDDIECFLPTNPPPDRELRRDG
jgi:site-specific DNA recombinase